MVGVAPSNARKRRMQLRAMHKSSNKSSKAGTDLCLSSPTNTSKRMRGDNDNADEAKTVMSSTPDEGAENDMTNDSVALSKENLASIRGVKKMARYVPDVPMTKEQLTLWRKEARRVRNRESASASRQKTRQRIEELEEEVGELKSRYSAALRRIVQLEAQACKHQSDNASIEPLPINHDSPIGESNLVSPPLSPQHDLQHSLSIHEDCIIEVPFMSVQSRIPCLKEETLLRQETEECKHNQHLNSINRHEAPVMIPNLGS